MARYRGRHAAARKADAGGGGALRRPRTVRRGAASAAVAAAAMAALTASQAPGADFGQGAAGDGGRTQNGGGQPGDDSYFTELPPLESPAPPGRSTPAPGGKDDSGIPATVLSAYKKAADKLGTSQPGCGLRWELLAAIGKVESGQARGGAVDAEGTTTEPILGPTLDGRQFAEIKDTDGGRLDGDATYDKAVGPLQFIPSTWAGWAADGNGDGREDPNNIFDAALAAGGYLCANGRDLTTQDGLDEAILSYNNSSDYLRTVLAWYEFYRKGTHEVPDGRGVLPANPSPAPGERDARGGDGKHARPGGGAKSPGKGGSSSGKPSPGSPSSSPSKPSPSKPGSSEPGSSRPGTSEPAPSKPGPSKPGPSKPGPSEPGPSEPGPSQPSKPAAASLQREGDAEISATAGREFADKLRVRAVDKAGKAVRGTDIRFEITGSTGARFPLGKKTATATTGADGIATAPRLSAGDTAGTFTVRATVAGRDLKAAEFKATVRPTADKLARTSSKALEAKTDSSFADPVEIKATYKGKPAAGLRITAQMINSATAAKPEEADKGPYFKPSGDDGKKLRTLTSLTTNAEGVLRLPRIHTDATTGEFPLRLTTPEGKTLTIPLKVTKP